MRAVLIQLLETPRKPLEPLENPFALPLQGVLPLLPALRELDLSMALQYELPQGIDRLTTLTELTATGEALDWGLEVRRHQVLLCSQHSQHSGAGLGT